MTRSPHPEQAPTVQKLRIRFAKQDRLRFTNHRDFQQTFERALRRARVPVTYSRRFTPHPKVSYANTAPTGTASEAEYLEISVTAVYDPTTVTKVLNDALPTGLDIVAVVEAENESLTDRLQTSKWEIMLPDTDRAVLAAAAAAFLAAPRVEVQQITKKKLRTLDTQNTVVQLGVRDDTPTLRAVVRHQTPTVRPDNILAALQQLTDLPLNQHLTTRRAQGPLDTTAGTVNDPLATSQR